MVLLNSNILLEISSFLTRDASKYFTVISRIIKDNYSMIVKKFILKEFERTGVELKESITIWEQEGKFIDFYNIPCENCNFIKAEDQYGHFFYVHDNIVNKKSSGYAKNNNIDGEFKMFFKNGNIKMRRFYKDGESYGIITTYYENGNIKLELFMNIKNQKDSMVKRYDEKGILIKEFLIIDPNITNEDFRAIEELYNMAM